jgi:hypothetical protein
MKAASPKALTPFLKRFAASTKAAERQLLNGVAIIVRYQAFCFSSFFSRSSASFQGCCGGLVDTATLRVVADRFSFQWGLVVAAAAGPLAVAEVDSADSREVEDSAVAAAPAGVGSDANQRIS